MSLSNLRCDVHHAEEEPNEPIGVEGRALRPPAGGLRRLREEQHLLLLSFARHGGPGRQGRRRALLGEVMMIFRLGILQRVVFVFG